ncbi:MAG TPA: TIGR01777 family oxidoreductase [Anaeromyxobacteraceae bacterium]|nr:TIGR01777 family oxidoreductase [Anaeromyxobacteraceae bacterium]
MKALVSGATGFLGRAVCARLDDPTILSRDPDRARAALRASRSYAWDLSAPPPLDAFDGVEAVLHFAAEPLTGGRFDRSKARRVRESRVGGTRLLVEAMSRLERRPAVLVSASAVGFYGSRGDELLTEESGRGEGALAELCEEWEREALQASPLGVRVVTLRIGVVLGPDGGALAKMLPAFRLGLGGRLGSGRQWVPWIHRDDVAALALFAARTHALQGALNAVAPLPARNAELTAALAAVLHRPAALPVPAAALRLAVGDLAAAVLASQRVVPKRAVEAGFAFAHPDLREALRAAVSGERVSTTA